MSFGGQRAMRRLLGSLLVVMALSVIPLTLPSAASATVVRLLWQDLRRRRILQPGARPQHLVDRSAGIRGCVLCHAGDRRLGGRTLGERDRILRLGRIGWLRVSGISRVLRLRPNAQQALLFGIGLAGVRILVRGDFRMRPRLSRRTRARAQVALAAVGLTLTLFATAVFTRPPGRHRVMEPGARPRCPRRRASRCYASQPARRRRRTWWRRCAKPQRSTACRSRVRGMRLSSGAWLIPGSGWMCIATTDSEGLGMSCATLASAEAGKLAFVVRESPGDGATVVGVAPDGESEAAARTSGGAQCCWRRGPRKHVQARGDGIARTTLSGPSGTLDAGE